MADDPKLRTSADDALASLFLDAGFGDDIRFDHLRNRWLWWDGVRWRPDKTRHVFEMLRQLANTLWSRTTEADGELRKMLLPVFNVAKKESVLKALSSVDGIAMAGDEWDRDPFLLGFDNGILDLRTTTFDAHPDPTTLVSKTVGCDWDPNATAPEFVKFMVSIFAGDADLIDYMMTVLGYSLFGMQTEQKFWMWVGRGSNGKGILARTMVAALGDYADAPSETMYMRTKFGAARSDAARPDLMRLQGVRFTAMSEPPGGHFNEELLKSHTGDDLILARDLYGKSAEMARFAPTHKIIFLTNDPPQTDDVGVSMRRRARVVRFEEDFTGKRADMGIEDRVRAQKQGILVLLAAFAKQWWNDGVPRLVEPEAVQAWSNAYIEENDPLTQFIEDACVLGPQVRGQGALLFAAYRDWAARMNVDTPLGQNGFGGALERRFRKVRTRTGAIYIGIKAKSAMEEAEDD